MNGQPASLHFGLSQQQQQQQTSLNNRIQQQQQNQQQNQQQQQPQLHQLALVSTNQQTQQHHNHQQQQQQTQQYLLQSNYLGLPAEVFTSGNITGNAPSTAIVVSSMGGGQSSYRPQQQQQQMYAQKESIHNSTAQGKETPSPLAALPLHQMAQLVQVQPELVIQMQQNYEAQIRALQMELQAVKNVPVVPYNPLIQPSGTTTLTLTPSTPLSGVKASHKRSQHSSPNIVETYCENIQMKQFTCKNCPYKTKSEASLIIHNTNHLVNQRYLHLPTTVFSVRPSPNRDSSTYMYPCGECSGKFSHNDLYLHIYQHHTGEAPFHCDECDLFFMHYEFLDDHQRSTHMKNPSKKKPRYHQPPEQQSQQNQQQNCQPPGGVPQLTYYSVVKCSKPFSVLTAMSRNPNSPGGPVGGLTWPGTTTTTGGGSAGVNNHEPEPVAYPYHHTVAHKRGRGRGGSSNANRTSIPFPSTSGTTSGSTSSTTSVNGTTRSEPEPNAGPDANGQYKCHFEECFFVSDSKDRLEFHLFAHRSSRFKCPYCPYVSNVLNDIKRHVVKGQKHEGVMFTCPNNPCDFGTNCDKTFRDHMRSVHFGKQTDDKQLTNFIEDMFRNGRTSTT